MSKIRAIEMNSGTIKKIIQMSTLVCMFCLAGFTSTSQNYVDRTYTITFRGPYSTHFSKKNKLVLIEVAELMKIQPAYFAAVTSYCTSKNPRYNQANWDRIDKTINYLIKKEGISSDRFMFRYGQEGGECQVVDIVFTKDSLEFMRPPPPLRKTQQ